MRSGQPGEAWVSLVGRESGSRAQPGEANPPRRRSHSEEDRMGEAQAVMTGLYAQPFARSNLVEPGSQSGHLCRSCWGSLVRLPSTRKW